MLSLQTYARSWPSVGMIDPEAFELQTRREYAAALKSLRDDARLNQQDVADRMGVTLQAYQNYEYAKRRFNRKLLGNLAAAFNIEVEALEARRAEIADHAPSAPDQRANTERPLRSFELHMDGRALGGPVGIQTFDPGQAEVIDFSRFFGPEWRVLELAGESMIPYAEPGGFVTYNIKRSPQRNKGCVIRTKAGEYYVKRYDAVRDGRLLVTELHPAERQISFDLKDIEGVYPIGLRMD